METFPFSIISPCTVVSIPNSISFDVNLITFVVASIRIHSNMDMVVLEGTAFKTILTAFVKLLLSKINFMVDNSFQYIPKTGKHIYIYNN